MVQLADLFVEDRAGRDAATSAPLLDKTFPFDQTVEALAYVEQGRAKGKVVIALD